MNKAVYTIASVMFRWAGAVTQVKLPFRVFAHCVTDRPTVCVIALRVRD